MKRHPAEADLALYAGGDLPFWQGLRMAWHLRACESCRHEVEQFRAALASIREEETTSAVPDWESLEAEMRANIRLGWTAGELVRPERQRDALLRHDWRSLAVVSASLAVVAVVGWTLHRPGGAAISRAPETGIALQSTAEGFSVRWSKEDAAWLGSGRAPVAAAVSWDGSVRAPFVDEETGQVTIYNVAAQ
jgi:hypothetical protein